MDHRKINDYERGSEALAVLHSLLSYGDNLHYEKFSDGSVKCIEDEVPFGLPDGWAWSKIGPLCEYITSGSRGWAQYYSETGILFLRMGNLSRDSLNYKLAKGNRRNAFFAPLRLFHCLCGAIFEVSP